MTLTWKESLSQDYRSLGLDPQASEDEIKRAYRELVKRWHPDRFHGNSLGEQLRAEEKFKEIASAYHRIMAAWDTGEAMRSAHPAQEEQPSETPPEQPRPQSARRAKSAKPHTSGSAQSASADASSHGSEAFQKLSRLVRRVWLGCWEHMDRRLAAAFVFLALLGVLFTYFSPLPMMSSPYVVKPPRTSAHPSTPSYPEPPSAPPGEAPAETAQSVSPPVATPSPEAGSKVPGQPSPSFFTLGSTPEHVRRVQGPPTRSRGQMWSYGLSDIHFKDGRVHRYNNFDGSLRVQMLPSKPVKPDLPFFSLGSTKDEVLSVQGTPTRVEEHKWYFGFSELRFKDGLVAGYDNFFGNLKVRMLPAAPLDPSELKRFFTIGSTPDEVLAVQGTPTSVQGNMWCYQFSNIIFKDGKVQSVVDGAGNLLFAPPEEATKAESTAAGSGRQAVRAE